VRRESAPSTTGGEMEESGIEDVEEIDTIIAELEISKGKGNLILCVVNSPAYRDRIIQALQRRFISKIIYVEKGDQIISILKNRAFDSAEILIWVMPEEPTEDLLNTLNNFRELFYDAKMPSLMFYNQAFSESVIRKAPDFWRYRGNYYELKGVEGGIAFEAFETLAIPFFYQNKEDLLRRKRINEHLLKTVKDKQEKANILTELGLVSYNLGELDKALEYFGKSLGLTEKLDWKDGMAANFGNIGIIYKIKGDLETALEYYGKSLKLNEELGSKEGMASNYGNLGIVYQIKGELDKALEYCGKSLKLNEELGSKEGMASNYGNLGIVYRIKGELDKALEYHEKALRLSEEPGSKKVMAIRLGNMGNVYLTKGELDKALEYYEKALELDEEFGKKEGVARHLGNIGIVYFAKGELEKALEYYEKALKLNEMLGIKIALAADYVNIGLIYKTKGELNKALGPYESALGIFKDVGIRIEIAQTLVHIGEIFVQKGDKERALEYYREAKPLAEGSSVFKNVSKRLEELEGKNRNQ
jgi:tetratricopeptide (TPR) repeat protein